MIAVAADPDLTPEQKLEKALAARQAQAPKLSSYMNPGAVNPSKLKATHQKRKLLWSKDKVGLKIERNVYNWKCTHVCHFLYRKNVRGIIGNPPHLIKVIK